MLDGTETFCLRLMENLIDRYIRENNAAMIYFHHGLNDWVYLGSDTKLYKQEMKNLIMQIKNGTIVHVTKGLVVDVKGTQLYPVEIELKNVLCPAYYMVAKRFLNDHYKMTPYFFRSEKKRDEIFDYLIKKGSPLKSSSTQDMNRGKENGRDF